MKNLFVTLGITLAALFGHAQTTLTERNHGLLPGNPNPMIVTTFSDPGIAGENVTWDFSALPQVEPFLGDVVEPGTLNPANGLQRANTCLVEDELQAFMKTSRRELVVLGLRAGSMERVYDTPVVKMKYPFSYGDHFEGQTAAIQQYTSGYSLPMQMSYDVKADAYGTLILPGTTLKDALRVVTTQNVSYGANATAPTYTIITYRWYVKAHRFPVLSLIFERRADGTLTPLKGAYNPIVVLPEVTISERNGEENAVGQVAELNAYPNPFANQLAVTYTLTGKSNVTIALYNIQGALARTLSQSAQSEGTYELNFDSQIQDMPAGQYILRVEANGNVLTQKLLKMN